MRSAASSQPAPRGSPPARPARRAAAARRRARTRAPTTPAAAPGAPSARCVAGSTRSRPRPGGRSPAAKPFQETVPAAGEVHEPARPRARAARAAPARGAPSRSGEPTWSSTTCTASRSPASRSIVATKLRPSTPYSQAVRTTVCRGEAAEHLALALELASRRRPSAGRSGRTRRTARGLPALVERRRCRRRRSRSRRARSGTPRAAGRAREDAGAVGVDRARLLALALGAVDVGPGGAVDDRVERRLAAARQQRARRPRRR